ncbi:hypothetical protein Tdes44962_MAKER02264 [Teratosphaeria destructans]|uniref:Uncharacterized protein n=1 Tax=Teratosphaeria destructans TaxID=418781 RepID=A0A9W7SUC7_9PEZI|nr:hypothetical protein Tdes44962_MAKER02264 [Teratosphaeria destructans]
MGLSRLPTLVFAFASLVSVATCTGSLSPGESLLKYYGVDTRTYKCNGRPNCDFAVRVDSIDDKAQVQNS